MDTSFGRIEGEHSLQQDLAAVNHKFSGRLPEYVRNCGNCTAAFELRRRGIDVEAQPRLTMSVNEWAGLFDGFQPQTPIGRTTAEVIEELEQQILSWGEGARGTIFGMEDGKPEGHFFSVEVSEGKVMFVDSQVNRVDVKWYFDIMMLSSIIYGRLDNLEPNRSILNAVKARSAQ